MGEYKSRLAADRKPSIEIRLPLVVRYLEAPLNQLVLKLDVAEEREERIEIMLRQICAKLQIATEPGAAA